MKYLLNSEEYNNYVILKNKWNKFTSEYEVKMTKGEKALFFMMGFYLGIIVIIIFIFLIKEFGGFLR